MAHSQSRDRTLFCFGLGYSAAALARRLQGEGWRVIGTTRSAEKAARLSDTGVETILDSDHAAIAEAVAQASSVLVSAGPDAAGDPTLRAHRAALETRRLDWIGYLSTTGVYGDHGGDWVDETAPLTPATARGRARVEAEAAWRDFCAEQDHPLHIFRLAGIYGPGRGPFAKLRAGTARRLAKPGQVFSRIHVEDIATVLAASIARPHPAARQEAAVYNVCDDAPAPPQDVIAYAAELIGLPVPPEQDFDAAADQLSPMARSFYAESKRVSNERIKRELGVALAYPDYQSGLRATLEAETRDAS